jgi:hypothetical protein
MPMGERAIAPRVRAWIKKRFCSLSTRIEMRLLLLLTVIALVIWFWLSSLRVREIANAVCSKTCQGHDVQFLDGTVALYRLGIQRDAAGSLQILRLYRFEYSDDGYSRHRGYIKLLGTRCLAIDLPSLKVGSTT